MLKQKLAYVIATTFIVSSAASAATFVVRPDRELVHRAEAIIVASALSSYSILNESGGIETVTLMSVEETIKGNVDSSNMNVVEPGGVYEETAATVAGAPRFAEGRRMLLFLMKTGQDRWSILDLIIGKFTFADDRLGQKLLVRDEGDIEGYDSDLRPHHELRRAADRFLDFVRAEARDRKGTIDYIVPT